MRLWRIQNFNYRKEKERRDCKVKEFLERLNNLAQQIETSPEKVDLGMLATGVKDLISLVGISTEKDEEELKLPKEFKECPTCGSTRRFVEVARTDDLKPLQGRTPVLMSGEYVYDGITGPVVLMGLFDVCCSCGILRCIVLDKIRKTIGPLPPPGRDGPQILRGGRG